MPLPVKVVEQLSRSPARTPGWSSQVLLFSATIFILSVGIYLGIQFGYNPFLKNQIEKLNEEIAEFEKQVPKNQQEEFIVFYSQLDNLEKLLQNQNKSSLIFSWLEQNINTVVQLDSFSYDPTRSLLTINGSAPNITNLAEQLNRFRNQSGVVGVQLSKINRDSKSNRWSFAIALNFASNSFLPPQGESPVIDSSIEEIPPSPEDIAQPTSSSVLDEGSILIEENSTSTQ